MKKKEKQQNDIIINGLEENYFENEISNDDACNEPVKDDSLKYFILMLCCTLIMGNYYAYDLPGALNNMLREWLNVSYGDFQWQLNILYSLYSIPNIILPLIGGYLMDKLGIKKTLMMFSFSVFFGSFLFALGIKEKLFWLLATGRFFNGFGGEIQDVIVSKIITNWFGMNNGFAFGINLALSTGSTALNDIVSPILGVFLASWVSVIICALSFTSGLILSILNNPKNDKLDEKSHLLNNNEEINESKILGNLFDFKMGFWFIWLITILLEGCIVVPFIHICTDLFVDKFGINEIDAGKLMALPDFIAGIGSPLIGLIIDKFGYRNFFIIISSIMNLIAFISLFFTDINPLISMIILGISYTIFQTVLWACISLVCEEEKLGMGYGITTCGNNIAQSIVPLIIASLRDDYNDSWIPLGLFFVLMGISSIIISTILWYYDEKVLHLLKFTYEEPNPNFSDSNSNSDSDNHDD